MPETTAIAGVTFRLARTVALEDLLDAGTIVAIGSDWPIGPFDPREIIAIAEMRRRVGAVDIGAVVPSQRLTRAEVLTAYTLSAARTAGVDERAIAPGRSASFTVFQGDLFAPPPTTCLPWPYGARSSRTWSVPPPPSTS
ncbi:amidohydrolase family protein [Microbacterium sp. KSW2-21]|uniref:Amidohydrolase family protein n=1 Tax=Microbacterium algihabitans TaxID=3075992 RepID=A0ABU3RWU8_9MICO|nr:amidohydrolase family protein [Microbacterium sp. KSW2-21]MDU0327356.1 amidohydrolase family protein [Microbacterium sp. KSW2-21]